MKGTIDQVLTYLLIILILLSAVTIGYGGLLFIMEQGEAVPDYKVFNGEPKSLKGLSGIMTLLIQGSSLGIIQAGLLLLMVIPVVRMALITLYFILEKERLYIWVSAAALIVLIGSICFEAW